MSIHIEVFEGKETLPYMRTLSEMRMKAFRHFPYLYVGNLEDDLGYSRSYSKSQALLIIAFKQETIVGIYSGMPMNTPNAFLERCWEKLTEEGIDINKCFYAGEIIVEPSFQGEGIGSQLMHRLLHEVKRMGFTTMMGVTSIRSPDHPLRPQDYFDTDQLWGKYGFVKTPLVFSMAWPTLQENGEVKEATNELACWLNPL